jgi:hypothetical protein
MKRVLCIATVVLGGLLVATAVAGDKPEAPAEGKKDAAEVVREYFQLIPSDKEPGKALDLFLTPDAAVTGVSGGAGRDAIWTKPAKEVVEIAKQQAATPHVVDTLTATSLGDTLAVVSADFHTDYVRGKAAFTLTREGGEWRITGVTFESRPAEQK